MKHVVTLKNGVAVPALGQGTWYLGDNRSTHDAEIAALRKGIECGMTLIDTAEMYGNGRSEALVGEAIRSYPREQIFLVSKVLPSNAGREGMARACEASLMRCGTDYFDLYIYHWRGSIPLAETVDCLEELRQQGKIRAWGVSNFDIDDMEELMRLPGAEHCQVNQVLYHLGSRGIDYSLLPWMEANGIALMAYCPLAQGGSLRRDLLTSPALLRVSKKHAAAPTQILLAWAIRSGHAIAIPRTRQAAHTELNAKADRIALDADDIAVLDAAFPPPTKKMRLDVQ